VIEIIALLALVAAGVATSVRCLRSQAIGKKEKRWAIIAPIIAGLLYWGGMSALLQSDNAPAITLSISAYAH
jgi:hypothetical protein